MTQIKVEVYRTWGVVTILTDNGYGDRTRLEGPELLPASRKLVEFFLGEEELFRLGADLQIAKSKKGT